MVARLRPVQLALGQHNIREFRGNRNQNVGLALHLYLTGDFVAAALQNAHNLTLALVPARRRHNLYQYPVTVPRAAVFSGRDENIPLRARLVRLRERKRTLGRKKGRGGAAEMLGMRITVLLVAQDQPRFAKSLQLGNQILLAHLRKRPLQLLKAQGL